jgi:hypothetical protein
MMHFNLLHGYQLGLYAGLLQLTGDDDAIMRNGRDVENYDYRAAFEADDSPPELLN